MVMILSLQFRLDKLVVKQQHRLEKGQIIIFPGVRYERMPEASTIIAKSAKRSRKTA